MEVRAVSIIDPKYGSVTVEQGVVYHLYVKAPGAARFKPVNREGYPVSRKVYAARFIARDAASIDGLVNAPRELAEDNPGWAFELRKA